MTRVVTPFEALAVFLLQRIDEDECLARTAFADHNGGGADWTEIWSGTVWTGDDEIATGDSGLSRHIVRHDPARVLRECAAKRQILRTLTRIPDGENPETWTPDASSVAVLTLLAQAYQLQTK